MSTADNGAIDYRRRLRERRNQQSAAADPVTAASTVTDATYDTPLEHAPVVEVVTTAVEVLSQLAPAETKTPATPTPVRTPQAVREQAKAAMTRLFSVSDAEYTAMMTELSAADPILYAAVVDAINDARAAETKTA